MDSNIQQDDCYVEDGKNSAALWLRYVVSEVELSVGKDHDCYFIYELNPVRKGWLHRIKMQKEAWNQERYLNLNCQLRPEKSSKIDSTHSKEDASAKKKKQAS